MGLEFCLSVLPSFLNAGRISAYSNAVGKEQLDNTLLKLWHRSSTLLELYQ